MHQEGSCNWRQVGQLDYMQYSKILDSMLEINGVSSMVPE